MARFLDSIIYSLTAARPICRDLTSSELSIMCVLNKMGGIDYGKNYMMGIPRNKELMETVYSLQQQATPHYLKDAREAWGGIGTGIGMVTGGFIPYKDLMMMAYDVAEAKRFE